MLHKQYITNQAFSSHAKQYYLPRDKFINVGGGRLEDNKGNFVCMAHSQRAKDLIIVGNDDGKGTERYELIKDIKSFFERNQGNPTDFTDRIEPGLLRMWDDDLAMKYNQNAADGGGSWIWLDDFYCAPIKDLQYIKKLLYND